MKQKPYQSTSLLNTGNKESMKYVNLGDGM